MANLNTIKSWFKTGLRPTSSQFSAAWDSFFHKDDMIPVGKIEKLDDRFGEKIDREVFDIHENSDEAHNELFTSMRNEFVGMSTLGFKGLAESSTIPSAPSAQSPVFYQASAGVTYPNFKNSANVVITIPLKEGDKYVVNPRILSKGTSWSGVWELIDVPATPDLSGYMPTNEYLIKPKNLFNVNATDYTLGSFINYLSGATSSNSAYNATGFIRVIAGKQYTISYKSQIAWYNSSKQFIAGNHSTDTNKTQTAPTNAAYLRCTVDLASWATFQVEEGAVQTAYEPYTSSTPTLTNVVLSEEGLPKNARTTGVKIKPDDLSFATHKKSINLANINAVDAQLGRYVAYDFGGTTANALFNATGFIPVVAGQQYTLSFKHQIAWYSANKVYISGNHSTDTNKTRTAPAGAAYLRCTVELASWPTFQVVKGAVQMTYDSFYDYYLLSDVTLTDQNPTDNSDILVYLPTEVCVAVGRTIELYNNQISWCGNQSEYSFFWTGIGKCMKRKWTLTGTTIGENILTLRVYDKKMNLVVSKTTTVKVVANTTTPFTTCVIGDSLSNDKPWLGEITSLSGGNITWVGTRRTATRTEARSGAAPDFYLGNYSYSIDALGTVGNDGREQRLNPFWNPTTATFDFSYYKSNYNQNPGRILIWLGTNNINIDPASHVMFIKAIVDGIHASDPNMKVFVVTTLFRGNQDGLGNQLGTDGYNATAAFRLQEDRKVYNLQVALTDALTVLPNTYMVPLAACFDSEYNYGSVTTPVNPRSSQLENIPVEATHPEDYFQCSDVIYSALAAHV